jgi:hypothetical protein
LDPKVKLLTVWVQGAPKSPRCGLEPTKCREAPNETRRWFAGLEVVAATGLADAGFDQRITPEQPLLDETKTGRVARFWGTLAETKCSTRCTDKRIQHYVGPLCQHVDLDQGTGTILADSEVATSGVQNGSIAAIDAATLK